MPNDYFQFQRFRVEQGHCAMKVSTDACLLGAAVDLTGVTRLLDVGTGTGLLALMAAQRHPTAAIEAVELDPAAAAQAARNVAASPWAGRIRVLAHSLARHAATQPAPYSHVVCNPPFFGHSLPSAGAARRLARHAGPASLSFEELAGFAADFLLPAGNLTVLLPPPEMAGFERTAAAVGLRCAARLAVRHRPAGRVTRLISCFSRAAVLPVEAELIIHAGAGPEYSVEFRRLLSGFYLAL